MTIKAIAPNTFKYVFNWFLSILGLQTLMPIIKITKSTGA
jgi:hypothetical protein